MSTTLRDYQTEAAALRRARAALRITARTPGTRPADARQQAMQARRAAHLLAQAVAR